MLKSITVGVSCQSGDKKKVRSFVECLVLQWGEVLYFKAMSFTYEIYASEPNLLKFVCRYKKSLPNTNWILICHTTRTFAVFFWNANSTMSSIKKKWSISNIVSFVQKNIFAYFTICINEHSIAYTITNIKTARMQIHAPTIKWTNTKVHLWFIILKYLTILWILTN